MTTLCPPPRALPPSLPPYPRHRMRLVVPSEANVIPSDLEPLLSRCTLYPNLRHHFRKSRALTFPLQSAVLEEVTQLESDLYAWNGDESLWDWLKGVHAEHNMALRLRLHDATPKVLRIVMWSQQVSREAQAAACRV